MSKAELTFSPLLPRALKPAAGLGEYAVRALLPWKDGPVWADILPDAPELSARALEAINGELEWLWDHFGLAQAQFAAGSELLREANADLPEGEEAVTPEQLQEDAVLESIQIVLGGERVKSLQLWYDGGEAFCGASILLEWRDRKLAGIEIRD